MANPCTDMTVEAADPATLEAEVSPKVKAALAAPAAGAEMVAAGTEGGYGGRGCSTCEFDAPRSAWFRGHLHFDLFDLDENPNHVISIKDGAYVCLHWYLKGELARLICGRWCVQVYLENLGKDVEGCRDITLRRVVRTLRCNQGHYWLCIKIPPGQLDPDMCSCLYKLAVSIQLIDKCGKPVPFAGFCEGPVIQFYDPD